MLRYCPLASQRNESIFLYGASSDTLTLLQQRLTQDWPTLQIAGAYSPPFRPLSAEEDKAIVKLINESGAGTVWVSLGCPKQELWMAKQRGHIRAVMIGVGAAFDYHAGTLRRAPRWMRKKARVGMVLPPGDRAAPAVAALPRHQHRIYCRGGEAIAGRRRPLKRFNHLGACRTWGAAAANRPQPSIRHRLFAP